MSAPAAQPTRNAISKEMARITREFYGKGPARTRTFVIDAVIFSVLDDVLTPVEAALKDGGRSDLVRRVRLSFQDTMAQTFTDAVEQLTGARVVAYHSQILFDPDLAVEIFVLDRPIGPATAAGTGLGQVRSAVSDAIVRLLRESWGKGPTSARVYIEEPFVFCVLEDVLTTVERTLVEGGESDLVRELRMEFHTLEHAGFAERVEAATGREVLTSHSQIVFDPDLLFMVFVLADHPAGGR